MELEDLVAEMIVWLLWNCWFQAEMQRFTAKIVDMMQQEKLYASQGGPIILSQVTFIFFPHFLLIDSCCLLIGTCIPAVFYIFVVGATIFILFYFGLVFRPIF